MYFNRLLDFVGERLKAEPEQSDVVHDLLAYLAEQMIEMNKQKQVAVKDFLTWLEGEIGCLIDELSGKTIIQGFYEQAVDKCCETLGNNAKKLSVDAKSPVFQEEFTQRYESQMAILRPLMERIQRTDELIDQIVYKLYGLTEEEIKIIEDCQRISLAD